MGRGGTENVCRVAFKVISKRCLILFCAQNWTDEKEREKSFGAVAQKDIKVHQ